MKKVIGILVMALGLTATTQAQKGKKGDFEKLSTEQRTKLAIKRMTLKLDLTPSQLTQIKPLVAKKIANRKAMNEKRKSLKNNRKKLTANERYEMKNAKLDRMIAFKADMKRILTEKQYEKFEKMAARKAHKIKNRKGKRGKKGKKKQRA